MWRPSRQARSFEGSGPLGPDGRARVQLESPSLGVPATRRASEFKCVTRPKTPPISSLRPWGHQHWVYTSLVGGVLGRVTHLKFASTARRGNAEAR